MPNTCATEPIKVSSAAPAKESGCEMFSLLRTEAAEERGHVIMPQRFGILQRLFVCLIIESDKRGVLPASLPVPKRRDRADSAVAPGRKCARLRRSLAARFSGNGPHLVAESR
jgi:hypothetical protein